MKIEIQSAWGRRYFHEEGANSIQTVERDSFTSPQAQSGSYALFELIVRVVLNINMQVTLQDFKVAMDSFNHFEMKMTYFYNI